jgi:hypothetical protein
LITTRSDSFTAYIALQGWRNAGDPNKAEMAVQRRLVVVFDRSGVAYTTDPGNPLGRPVKDIKVMSMPQD